MSPMRETHRVGKGVVPRALVVDRIALRVTGGQRLDQRAFPGRNTVAQGKRGPGSIMGSGKRRSLTIASCGFN